MSAQLEVLGHLNAHDDAASSNLGYLEFLERGLAKARGEAFVPRPEPEVARHVGPMRKGLALAPARPEDSLLATIERRGFGQPSASYLPIDATAFAEGGRLVVTARVGEGDAAGRFELCTGDGGGMVPQKMLAKVAPGTTERMELAFDAGARFGILVRPAGGATEGQASAFLLTVRVEPAK